jgi:hypothetical protein
MLIYHLEKMGMLLILQKRVVTVKIFTGNQPKGRKSLWTQKKVSGQLELGS